MGTIADLVDSFSLFFVSLMSFFRSGKKASRKIEIGQIPSLKDLTAILTLYLIGSYASQTTKLMIVLRLAATFIVVSVCAEVDVGLSRSCSLSG